MNGETQEIFKNFNVSATFKFDQNRIYYVAEEAGFEPANPINGHALAGRRLAVRHTPPDKTIYYIKVSTFLAGE